MPTSAPNANFPNARLRLLLPAPRLSRRPARRDGVAPPHLRRLAGGGRTLRLSGVRRAAAGAAGAVRGEERARDRRAAVRVRGQGGTAGRASSRDDADVGADPGRAEQEPAQADPLVLDPAALPLRAPPAGAPPGALPAQRGHRGRAGTGRRRRSPGRGDRRRAGSGADRTRLRGPCERPPPGRRRAGRAGRAPGCASRCSGRCRQGRARGAGCHAEAAGRTGA